MTTIESDLVRETNNYRVWRDYKVITSSFWVYLNSPLLTLDVFPKNFTNVTMKVF